MASTTCPGGAPADLFPKGAWDTHHHIFERKYSRDKTKRGSEPDVHVQWSSNAWIWSRAGHSNRHLTPPAATIQDFAVFRKRLGITKSVLTHGLSYGDDCTSLKAFIEQLGRLNTSGVGVIDPYGTSDDEMRDMQASGICGLRVNLYPLGAMEDVELQKKALRAYQSRIQSLGLPWSLTMTTIRTEFWDVLEPFVRRELAPAGTPLVTDHFALLKAPSMLPPEHRQDPTQQPGFQAVMRLVRDGHLYIKLSAPYRVSDDGPGYRDVRPLVRACVDANRYQVLWGSDWPHTPRMKVRSVQEAMQEAPFLDVDDDAWLRTLRSWLSEHEWDLIFVQNPQRLFGKRAEW